MISRCLNNNDKSYVNYGGRGISVCDSWLSLENFISDMYPTFQEGLSIDRIDNNKGYFKDNCRWTDKMVQNRNTRKIRKNNKSGYRGVYFYKRDNIWAANIRVNNKAVYLGRFKTAFEGAKAYDKYIIDNNLEHTINGIGL